MKSCKADLVARWWK